MHIQSNANANASEAAIQLRGNYGDDARQMVLPLLSVSPVRNVTRIRVSFPEFPPPLTKPPVILGRVDLKSGEVCLIAKKETADVVAVTTTAPATKETNQKPHPLDFESFSTDPSIQQYRTKEDIQKAILFEYKKLEMITNYIQQLILAGHTGEICIKMYRGSVKKDISVQELKRVKLGQ